jgi:hypothetical protein
MIELKKSPVVFDEEAHTYRLEDKRLLGITGLIHSILGLGVYPDASDYTREYIIPKAGSRGTAIHHAIETYDKLGIAQDTQVVNTRFGSRSKGTEKFEDLTWDVSRELANYIRHRQGFTPLANELTVSDNNKWASQIDNVWQNDKTKGIWLVDTKSNNLSYYPTCGYFHDGWFDSGVDALKEYLSWQLSIYAELFEAENPGLKVEGLACNHLREDEANFWVIDRKPSDQVWNLLLTTYWFDENGKAHYSHPDAGSLMPIYVKVSQVKTESVVSMDVVKYVTGLLKQYNELEKSMKEAKEAIRKAMEVHEVKSFDCGFFKATIAKDSQTTTFDSKALQADMPEVYQKYLKTSYKKGGFTIKLKEE